MPETRSSVLSLFAKPKHGSPMVKCQELFLKTGYGIDGDVNANSISPRQVLIVRNEDLLELSIKPGELRENIVISGMKSSTFVPGSLIKSKGGVTIRLTFYCEPCKRISHLVNSFKSIEGKRGILGVVINDGVLSIGDEINVQPNAFSALPEIPYERFLNFIAKVPVGKVVTYRQVITGIGVAEGYFRAIPKYLQKASIAGYPVHRVVDSEGNLTSHISNQREKLESENIQVISEADLFGSTNRSSVSLKEYLWEDSTIYLV